MATRDGFNFYRAYYDVYKQIPTDKERLQFIDALLERQFNGMEPTDLKGMALFAYVSQKYNIDKQIKGWEDKTGQTLHPPTEGGSDTPCQQVQVQVQVEGKEKVQVQGDTPAHPLLVWLQSNCPTVCKLEHPLTELEAAKLVAEYPKALIADIFESMENFKTLLKKYKSANLTFRQWAKLRAEKNKPTTPTRPNTLSEI